MCEKRAFLARNLARVSEHMETLSICMRRQSILSSDLSSLCKFLCGLLWREACCFHLVFQNQCLHPEMPCLGACSDLTMEKPHSSQKQWHLICTIMWSVPYVSPEKPVCLLIRSENTETLSSSLGLLTVVSFSEEGVKNPPLDQ